MTYNIKIFGIVQGVGFRPFIKNLADNFFISGTVANKGSYVEIFAQSSEQILKNFLQEIPKKSPPRSAVLKIYLIQKIFPQTKKSASLDRFTNFFIKVVQSVFSTLQI